MSTVRQVGIKLLMDAQSVTTELPKAAREFTNLGSAAEQGAARATRSVAQVSMAVSDIVQGAAGLHIVAGGIQAINNAITALPRNAFDYSKQLEVSQVGMAGILGSMMAINGKQLDYNAALRISSEYVRKLGDDALRTAASNQELTQVFQALLAPGLSANMTLEQIRQLTVVGTNAVKSMGLDASQVVQELRDLVAGGITPASSTLASSLGLKDSDIAAAKASSEGLFAFLMQRLEGFKASSEAFNDTLKGKLDSVREGSTRVAAEGLEPLIVASKQALGDISALFVTIEQGGQVQLNQELVGTIRAYATSAAEAMAVGREWVAVVWENRDAAIALGSVYAGIKLGSVIADMVASTAAKVEAAQASRLVAAQQAAEAAGNVEVAATSRQKVTAYLAELSAKAASAQADVAAQAAQLATLATTREAIVAARAEVVAKMDSVRATMAQAEAQIAAARAAGAQSIALAAVREGTQALTVAQARHAVLMTELATLGTQQARVQAAIAAATTAQTAAQGAAAASATQLAAAQGAASVAGRALSGVVGFLGGPIGIVTTALTLGVTAWTLWGSAGSTAERKVQGEVSRSTGEIIADLDKQITELSQRNALAAAGMGDLAKKGGEAAQRLGELQVQIDNLQAGKGPDGGAALPEAARVDMLQKLLAQYGTLAGKIKSAEDAQASLDSGTGKLSLTVAGSEQAWRKANDGVKTAISIQQEYTDKLHASRSAWDNYKKALEQKGEDPAKIAAAQKEQDQVEKSLAEERDKKIKELGASAASARAHAIDAQIATTKQGYKLLAAQTADSLDEIDSLHKRGGLGDSDALERRTAVQLADIDAQQAALQAELQLVKGRKDSAKEQATLIGELAELEQKRSNILSKAARDQSELDAQATDALERRLEAALTAAQQQQESVRVAQLEAKEIGKTGEALGALRQARVEETAARLEAQAVAQDEIDLSGQTSAALRAQAQAIRDAARIAWGNEAARSVADYAKALRESADAAQFELSLMGKTERERAIAIDQYRIEADLLKRIESIKAQTPDDPDKRASLIGEATAAAQIANSTAIARAGMNEVLGIVQSVDRTAHDAFVNVFDDAGDAAKRLGKTIQASVLDLLYQMTLKRWVVSITASIASSLTGVAVDTVTGGRNLLGLASNASSVYNLGSNALGWLGIGSGAASAASGLGLTAAGSGLGLTVGGSGLGLTASSAGASSIGAGIGSSIAGGGAAASGGIASALSAIPGWGWGLAAAAVLASLFKGKSGTLHTGGMAQYSEADGLRNSVERGDFGLNIGMVRGADTEKAVSDLAKGLTNTFDRMSRAFGGKGGYQVATGYADDTSKDGAWGALRISQGGKDIVNWNDTQTGRWAAREFSDGDAGKQEFANAIAQSARDALKKAVGETKWAQDALDALGDKFSLEQLDGVVQEISAGAQALEQLRKSVAGFGDMSDGAVSALVKERGGVGAVAQDYASFVDNYYSDAEKTAAKTRDIKDALAEVGLEMPKTRAGFRALVEQQQALGESGARALAVLFDVDEAFADITPAASDASDAVANIGKTIKDGLGMSADGLASLLRDSVTNAGSEQEASRMASEGFQQQIYDGMFEAMTQGLGSMMMDAIVGPLVDSMVMGANMSSLSMATGGMAAATGMATGGAVAATGLATGGAMGGAASAGGGAAAGSAMASGGAAAASALVAGGSAAGAQVADVVERARQYMASFTAIMKDPGIRDQIANAGDLLGNVAGELWKEKGTFYQDVAFAGGAMGSMSGAAKEAASAWKQTADSIIAEVKRIRGEVANENKSVGFAHAEAQFAIANAQARAGDEEAAKSLPALSRAMLQLGESTMATAAEYRYLQASTAATLQATAELLAKKYNVKLPAFGNGGDHSGGWAMVGEYGPELAWMPPAHIYTAGQTNSMRDALGGGSSDSTPEMMALMARWFGAMVGHLDRIQGSTTRMEQTWSEFERSGVPIINQPETQLEIAP